MFRKTVAAIIAATVLVMFAVTMTTATGQEQPPVASADSSVPPAKPVVVATRFIRPARVVHRTASFTPPAAPSVGFVRDVILPYEAARWGASLSHLRARAYCESHFQWNAVNGQYRGIGQFASSTFWRGVGTLGSRKIAFTSTRTRALPVMRIRTYSDGNVERMPRWRIHQRVVTRHVGRLRVVAFDAWTEARIMAQAMVGRSAVHDSEWSCR